MQNQFPCLVYKNASTHVVANDEEQFQALIMDGWFPSVPEAISGKLIAPDGSAITHQEAFGRPDSEAPADDAEQGAPVVDAEKLADAPPTRIELEQKAAELGIKFQPNIGDEKLAAKIAEALKV